MDFIVIVLIILFFGYRNASRAYFKGASPVLWGIITVVLFITGTMLGSFIDIIGVILRHPEFAAKLSSGNVKDSQQLTLETQQYMLENPFINSATIMVCAVGGYLLVRYILNRRPDVKERKTEL